MVRQRVSRMLTRLFIRVPLELLATTVTWGVLSAATAFRLAGKLDGLTVALAPHRGTRRRLVSLPHCRAEWLWHNSIAGPPDPGAGVIVYLHGGGFISCGLNTHRRLGARLARESGCSALAVEYRQLPSASFDDMVEDAIAAYLYVLGLGYQPDSVVLAGDSAGGGLAFAAALRIRGSEAPMPAAIAAIAPWVIFDKASQRASVLNRSDALISARLLNIPAVHGLAHGGGLDALWSPVSHDFKSMPPAFIQVASDEILRLDAEVLAQCYREAGEDCELQIWNGAFHVFQAAADFLPDARAAIAEMARFISFYVRADARLPTEVSATDVAVEAS